MKWQVKAVFVPDEALEEGELVDIEPGWEPFGVAPGDYRATVVLVRRAVPEVTAEDLRSGAALLAALAKP